MSRPYPVPMTARLAFLAILFLAGCASTVAVGTAANHDGSPTVLIQASSNASKLLGQPYVTITSIDGQAVDGTSFAVAAGRHAYKIHCVLPGPAVAIFVPFSNDYEFSFDAEAGHEYQFKLGTLVVGDKACSYYVYDHTGGREPEDETLSVDMDALQGPWHEFSSDAADGRTAQLLLPMDQYRLQKPQLSRRSLDDAYFSAGWQQMFDIRSFVRLDSPGSAESYFQRAIGVYRGFCTENGVHVDVISDTVDDVVFALGLAPDCEPGGVRVVLGRVVGGKYSMHTALLVSRAPLDETTRAAWLGVLKNATIVDKN
jgi:hypothetical protein